MKRAEKREAKNKGQKQNTQKRQAKKEKNK